MVSGNNGYQGYEGALGVAAVSGQGVIKRTLFRKLLVSEP